MSDFSQSWGQTGETPRAGLMGGSSNLRYWQRVKNLFGSSLIGYWPLWEASGSVAEDISGNGRNGAYSNVALAEPGLGDGKTSAKFNGATSYCNIYSESLAAAFNGQEFSVSIWYKVAGAGVWTDGTPRDLMRLTRGDGQNHLNIQRNNTNGEIQVVYIAGGIRKDFYLTNYWAVRDGLGWNNLIFSASKTEDRARVYVNGQLFSSVSSLGSWVGSPIATGMMVGASSPTPAAVWNGWLQHDLIRNQAFTDLEAYDFCHQIRPGEIISVLGDSISIAPFCWPYPLQNSYTPVSYVKNHAVAGQSIMTHMDAQTLATAGDGANKIILALGTNDNDAGDMVALQAKVESNIVALKSSNPGVSIYYMNLLPRWTNNTGATPVDKSHIRAAIAAACAAQSVTCWDTFTDPWITAGQTTDGLHPTAAGHAAIATRVLALLP
jgi:hypothetical protein